MTSEILVYDNIPFSLDQMISYLQNEKPSRVMAGLWSRSHSFKYHGHEENIEIIYERQLNILRRRLKGEQITETSVVDEALTSISKSLLVDVPKYKNAKTTLYALADELGKELLDELDMLGRLHGSIATLTMAYYGNLAIPKERIRNMGRLVVDALHNTIDHTQRGYIKGKLPTYLSGILFDDLREFDPVKVKECMEWIKENVDATHPITFGDHLAKQTQRTFGRIREVIEFYQNHYEQSKPTDILRNRTSLAAILHGLFSRDYQTMISWYMSITEQSVREKFQPKY